MLVECTLYILLSTEDSNVYFVDTDYIGVALCILLSTEDNNLFISTKVSY